ncbi:MAG: DUF2249 domain-containing protein [Magnetococcales bacterium]|nr:DUF2249 domain-containing protein [Magnetococcales bacterium]
MSSLFLDVRSLPAPEPLHQILTSCNQLQTADDVLTVHHRCYPCLLGDRLRQRGLTMAVQSENDELFVITIKKDTEA